MAFLVIFGVLFIFFRLKKIRIGRAKPSSDHDALPKLQSSPPISTRRTSSITCESAPGGESVERNHCQRSRSVVSQTRPSAEEITPVKHLQETFPHSRSGNVALIRLGCSEAERRSTVTTIGEGVEDGRGARVKRISCEFHRHSGPYDALRTSEEVNSGSQTIYESLRKGHASGIPSQSSRTNADSAIQLVELIHTD